jgi:hypothetical protein
MPKKELETSFFVGFEESRSAASTNGRILSDGTDA